LVKLSFGNGGIENGADNPEYVGKLLARTPADVKAWMLAYANRKKGMLDVLKTDSEIMAMVKKHIQDEYPTTHNQLGV
jgi:hypothetical protein